MTSYGIKLEEQQVRRICQDGKKLSQRLTEFLLSGAAQSFELRFSNRPFEIFSKGPRLKRGRA